MAYIKIEPSGCYIHKGWIQVRLSMYLEPSDPRYNEHHVFVVDETSAKFKAGYKGAMDAEGSPTNQADYDAWLVSLPHIWRDNPFNNHFIYVDTSETNVQILQKIREWFSIFYMNWCLGVNPDVVWRTCQTDRKWILPERMFTPAQLAMASTRLTQIKAMVI